MDNRQKDLTGIDVSWLIGSEGGGKASKSDKIGQVENQRRLSWSPRRSEYGGPEGWSHRRKTKEGFS